jgi:hypothetical protein
MIAEGTDGLSQADHGEGLMLGRDIHFFIPLHLDPIAREPKVSEWISDMTSALEFKVLTPSGWFETTPIMMEILSGQFLQLLPRWWLSS